MSNKFEESILAIEEPVNMEEMKEKSDLNVYKDHFNLYINEESLSDSDKENSECANCYSIPGIIEEEIFQKQKDVKQENEYVEDIIKEELPLMENESTENQENLLNSSSKVEVEHCSSSVHSKFILKEFMMEEYDDDSNESDSIGRKQFEREKLFFSNREPLTCPHCSKVLIDFNKLIKRPNVHSCKICDKIFNDRSHLATHMAEKIFTCKKCDASFNEKAQFIKHKRIHIGDKPFTCEHCYKKFKLKQDVKDHQKTHIFSCEHCEKQFKMKHLLQSHLRKHSGEKPHACNHCDKRFRLLSQLKAHRINHISEKPFMCGQCGTRFKRNNSLKRHVITHTDEKRFMCEQCGERFKQESCLRNHLKTHLSEKPFACEHCKRRFNRIDNLRTHLRIHTGEKPFACEHCDKKFNHNVSLKTHLMSIHKISQTKV